MQAAMLEEFRREVATMSALPPHPNVLRLIGACTAPPRLALVLEHCPRGSLFGLLHSPSVQLTWSRVVGFLQGAARGMAHLHAHKILHRDLKSANLLVDEHWRVKVADFGLSRVVARNQVMTGGLGTFEWMAPEVLGAQRYSEKADVYSFAIVIWECVARRLPYEGSPGMQAAMAVMNRGARPEVPGFTPPALATLMRACWAPLASERPRFVEVCAMLDAIARQMEEPQGEGGARAAVRATSVA
ncbi:unnamed protein product [Pedinophyceae sp. YPF-701]|nr:unnamed protein product [Pedinophyceae sp. YPF-701]